MKICDLASVRRRSESGKKLTIVLILEGIYLSINIIIYASVGSKFTSPGNKSEDVVIWSEFRACLSKSAPIWPNQVSKQCSFYWAT